jgi:HTH-type transcriptional repressor of NAD biosynthesis genes
MVLSAGDTVRRMAEPDVRRVCLLGAESTGKTTLAAALATRCETVWNPEYGRVYTEVGRTRSAPWESREFTHIAHAHCWYEDLLAGFAQRVLFCDTDAFTTAVFHEAYLGEPATGLSDLVERRYDLYLVCGLDIPYTHDGWREFAEQRVWMHEQLLEHARGSGSPWLLVEGAHDRRLDAARDAVDRILDELPSRTAG